MLIFKRRAISSHGEFHNVINLFFKINAHIKAEFEYSAYVQCFLYFSSWMKLNTTKYTENILMNFG